MTCCCAPKPEAPGASKSRDLASQGWALSVWIASFVALAVGWLIAAWRPYFWTAGLAAAGVLCIVNASRYGRLHCHITGPLFLIGSILTVLNAIGVLSISWNLLGAAILLGTAVAYTPEFVIGKHLRRRQPAAGATR